MSNRKEDAEITRCLEELSAIQPQPEATQRTLHRVRQALAARGIEGDARTEPTASRRGRIRKAVSRMSTLQKVAAGTGLAALLVVTGWAAQQVYRAVEQGTVEIAGQVVDDKTGKPVEQFMLQMGWPDAKDPNKVGWGGGQTSGKWREGKFQQRCGWTRGSKVWFRILADGYLPEPVTPEPLTSPAVAKDLVVRLKRGGEFRGRVVDHTGKPVAEATVYLAGNQALELTNGQNVFPWGDPGMFRGSKAVTDKDGRFTITGAGGAKDRLVVAAGGLVWLAQPQPGKEQAVRLPQPGKVSIAYDIEGAAQEGLFRLGLKTWEMPDWKGVVQTVRRAKCENGRDVTVVDLTPGEYDVCRQVEGLRVGDMGHGSLCDRGTLKVEPGKTAKLEFIRAKGSRVSGQAIGLKEANIAGAFITVRPEKATGDPRSRDEWKLPVYDALTCGADGRFKTSRLVPGSYLVVAEAYKPESRDEMRRTGRRLPSMIGTAKVTVPESGEPKPVRIELKPLKAVPTGRATQPTAERSTRKL
ncbi:MAG TPA: carboxypeptidase-like regulatory domain-containing protein [Phycisphaerae bacterium]|nr:carboxypeptidase-like regulatory domain-containing protein [Phycisphaerae bacterium]